MLRRWLKFTPTPKPSNIELKRDFQEFTPKLRLITFFHSETLDSSQQTREIFFYPFLNWENFLDTTTDFKNQQNLNNLSKYKTNLSKEYCQRIGKELKNNENIVKKEADKRVAVVLMDHVHYQEMI